jgi:hypothetical protein
VAGTGAVPAGGPACVTDDQIEAVHPASRGTYGARRVHTELTLGMGITVGHGATAMLMSRAGIKGLPGNRRTRARHQTPTASDLVHRQFTRPVPDQLSVTDISEHPAREGNGTARWSWREHPGEVLRLADGMTRGTGYRTNTTRS